MGHVRGEEHVTADTQAASAELDKTGRVTESAIGKNSNASLVDLPVSGATNDDIVLQWLLLALSRSPLWRAQRTPWTSVTLKEAMVLEWQEVPRPNPQPDIYMSETAVFNVEGLQTQPGDFVAPSTPDPLRLSPPTATSNPVRPRPNLRITVVVDDETRVSLLTQPAPLITLNAALQAPPPQNRINYTTGWLTPAAARPPPTYSPTCCGDPAACGEEDERDKKRPVAASATVPKKREDETGTSEKGETSEEEDVHPVPEHYLQSPVTSTPQAELRRRRVSHATLTPPPSPYPYAGGDLGRGPSPHRPVAARRRRRTSTGRALGIQPWTPASAGKPASCLERAVAAYTSNHERRPSWETNFSSCCSSLHYS